ncbi:MAG: lipid A biosynthesis (KDO)2-(lauroyl)-lipid IVA acyltransferase [Succinivibrio sp.]|nr:lipid A biosynthesis (KDO)2-(lauroyl)-lipid IVA acyltransferase [Succinivibrio sp.]
MNTKIYDLSFKAEYLHPRHWPSWLAILLVGLLSFIPAALRDACADLMALPLSKLNIKFRRKVLENFDKAFPRLTEDERQALYHRFVRVGLKVILGYGEGFFRSRNYLRKKLIAQGEEYFEAARASGRPIIYLGSHSWAIDHSSLYLSSHGVKGCSFMHTSKNPIFDYFMNHIRMRFGGVIYERSSGIKPLIRNLHQGLNVLFFPDEDLGAKSAVFVNFFASPKATLVVIPKLARLGRALVLPMFGAYNEQKHCYEVIFSPAFENYPSGDDEQDARRMNEAIEQGLQGREEQYMWFLGFYRTDPPPEMLEKFARPQDKQTAADGEGEEHER